MIWQKKLNLLPHRNISCEANRFWYFYWFSIQTWDWMKKWQKSVFPGNVTVSTVFEISCSKFDTTISNALSILVWKSWAILSSVIEKSRKKIVMTGPGRTGSVCHGYLLHGQKQTFLFQTPCLKLQYFPRYHFLWNPVYDYGNKFLTASSLNVARNKFHTPVQDFLLP